MLKKNKILTIVMALMLISPVFAEEVVNTGEGLTPIADVQENTAQTVTQELPAIDTIPYKQPVSKKKMAKKFLMAMGGVAISSILLFLLLTIYNNIRAKLLTPNSEQSIGETSLVTPENLTEAVKTFLEKTKY